MIGIFLVRTNLGGTVTPFDSALQPLTPPNLAGFGRRFVALAGPGVLVAVGYMDPGNWVTDIAGGARYGYDLLSVVLIANIVAMFLQALSARLGLGTGQSLAELCRSEYPKPIAMLLWVAAEIAMIATDLAEIIGSAIALNLLFGLDLILGSILTAASVVVFLALPIGRGRWLDLAIGVMVAMVGICFVVILAQTEPDYLGIAQGYVPQLHIVTDPARLLIALGIFGATVMPHNLYLHSGIVAERSRKRPPGSARADYHVAFWDSTAALTVALAINSGILIAAASIFHANGLTNVADIADAYGMLDPTLGVGFASTIFAIALLAAGQSSAITGTIAGQVVMEGFLRARIRPWIRRLLTRFGALAPVLFYLGIEHNRDLGLLLVGSQVVLTIQLPLAMIPLVHLVGSKRLMGTLAVGAWTRRAAWAIALGLAGLNIVLLRDALS